MFGKKSKSLLFASSPVLGRRSKSAAAPGPALNIHEESVQEELGNSKSIKLDAGQAELNSRQSKTHHVQGDEKSLMRLRKQLAKMTLNELEIFSSTRDDFILDCLVDQTHAIKKLQQERDDLKKQVSNLAKFNYAREPEFVRDRIKLREISEEVAGLIRLATSRHVEPTVNRLNVVLSKLTDDLSKHEELSESMARDFLAKNIGHEEFIDQYVKPRKEIYMKRSRIDKLTKETSLLATNNVSTVMHDQFRNKPLPDSPVPTPRQRKRVSFNK